MFAVLVVKAFISQDRTAQSALPVAKKKKEEAVEASSIDPQTSCATTQPIGVLEESARPFALARIVPLWSVKKDLWPVVPGVTGLAATA